ncbi:uncharacterized protein TEOVI_000494800 [Trypanosoma equiperdum]|uniref:Uncharacterized protein n=2 Tax=Trypanozoon TaxID=39700 RepID=Q385T5_TRYB2|nr:hypothetical protein, conserved [Trypanosoma brucei brucei TREU927]EAN79446.1 hypothetical protein, conserved [Trypanosoma brucei brucei TREU927]SCU66428.1 hypothetical protein, conserved [Trypanosoma equiperdum]
MFTVSSSMRCGTAYRTAADRCQVSRYHQQLVDSRYWNCSTPSQALSTLSVLVRSRTVVDALDVAALGALEAMAPSMTQGERTLLQKFSTFLKFKNTTCLPPASPHESNASPLTGDPNVNVVALYTKLMGEKPSVAVEEIGSISFSSDSILQLSTVGALMLFEMMVSTTFQPCASWRIEDNIVALLNHLRNTVIRGDTVDSRTLGWIMSKLNSAGSPIACRPSECGRLFKACVKRLNDILPQMSVNECLQILPLIDTTAYERPFIVCVEIVKRLDACSEIELSDVRTSTLLSALRCEDVTLKTFMKICRVISKEFRIVELSKGESLLFLTILVARLNSSASAEDVGIIGNNGKVWEALFAQLYVDTGDMSVVECIEALMCLEVLYFSPLITAVPGGLVEKLKKRVFFVIRKAMKQRHVTAQEVELFLKSLQRLGELLKRCLLFPLLEKDTAIITELQAELALRLVQQSVNTA